MFAVWGVKAKLVQIFSSFMFAQKIHSDDRSYQPQHFIFFPSPLHLEEALLGFSLAYSALLASPRLCSGAIIKWNRVRCTQALWCHTGDLITETPTKWRMGRITWTKRWFTSPQDRAEGKAQAFITILQMARHLKFRSCLFLEFST